MLLEQPHSSTKLTLFFFSKHTTFFLDQREGVYREVISFAILPVSPIDTLIFH